ncbi:MAG: S8 family serine peptidase [bacterium]|nr:S8 family serine peptidase [bacterium]
MNRLLLPLLLVIATIARADYAPGELFLKLRTAPNRSALDGQYTTASPRVNELAVRARSVDLPFAPYAELSLPLERILKLELDAGEDLTSLAAELSRDDAVEWVAFNNRYNTGQLDEPIEPRDSLFSDAWWLTRISADLAWEITRGDSTVLIGIIDTGIDHTHIDLAANIWRNRNEIEENGVDDDHNGFVDDVIGWDFVDAPSLPAAGDFLVRDNDPMDDMGHGTYVAGCAAAASDNVTCFPSVGFHCRIMPLRAGNANGTLEEDDVAAALLYGAANGAAIINMSFGDVVSSPLLREVVQIAYAAGVVLVASAGNANNDGIHYPSGYPEVISVGATDSLDRRASFSNRGPSVDLMAPGVNIGSTIIGDSCGLWRFPSGTSYAAPIVAGVAGLMLSVNPTLSPADVADILRSSADDLRPDGWDAQTSNGRVNARHAVENAAFGAEAEARILSPRSDAGVRGTFAIVGDAKGTSFADYALAYGLGENPTQWTGIATGDRRVQGDTLGSMTAPTTDTVLVIRLTVTGTTGVQSVDMAHVYVQNGPPAIDSMRTRLVLDGPGYGMQVLAWSNQFGRATLLMTNADGDSIREDFGYITDEHVAVISQSRYPGQWQAVLQVTNLLGETARSAPFPYSSVQSSILPYLYNRYETSLPHGLVSDFVSDYDCDGLGEVWLLAVDQNNLVDTLEPYEWNGDDFVETENTYGPHISQTYGDADGDGLMEMAGRRFAETRLWEQGTACGVPNNIVFDSTIDSVEFLVSRYVRVDSSVNRDDILARIATEDGSRFALFSVSTSFELTLRSILPNETDGLNQLGTPTTVVADLDRDGRLDIIYGDYDGEVIWCEWNGSTMQQVWAATLRQNDATAWMAVGDFNCDGAPELFAGSRSNAGYSSESQRLLQGWDFVLFECTGDNQLVLADSMSILGNENVSFNPASVTSVDLDMDQCDEIVISAFPDLYVVGRAETTGRLTPLWYEFPSKAGVIAVADFNSNGVPELVASDGERHWRIENALATTDAPFPPVLSGHPRDQHVLTLNWTHVPGALHYELYQAARTGNFEFVTAQTDTHFTWADAPTDSLYRFVVLTYDTSYTSDVSVFSNIVTMAANAPPVAEDSVVLATPRSLEITFSEPMSSSVFVQGNWRLGDGEMPAVVAEDAGVRRIYLVFDNPFAPGEYVLHARNLSDAQGTPLPVTESHFIIRVPAPRPTDAFVIAHRLADPPVGHRVEIEFSEPMSLDAVVPSRYAIFDPRLNNVAYTALSVNPLNPERTKVEVELDRRYPVGAIGLEVRLSIAAMPTTAGGELEPTNLLIAQPATNLDQVYVYPNPYKGTGAAGTEDLFFAALPRKAVIRVFTVNGVLLKMIEHDGASGHAAWNLRTDDGDRVASGVYLYSVEADGDKVMGKFAVLR